MFARERFIPSVTGPHKASNIGLPAEGRDVETSIELPGTDAYRILFNQDDLAGYIDQHGDIDVEYDEEFRVYRVAQFAESRAAAIESKARDCARWGCE